MLRSLLSAATLFFCTSFAVAQNGSISGKVTDAASGETVVGANVIIQGTSVGSATDMDGRFLIPNIKPGIYNLVISFVTYKAHLVSNVNVESGKISDIQIQMQEDVSQLQEVVVTGTREINNDFSLINAIKESKLVVSGISAEQISKLPDADAAQVMKRVPGITIVDNRFVMVRGVPERYNQVMINNAMAPSTEIDKRSFSFDLIPSGAVDQLLIYKSGTAELPGDFAGGIIQVITKQTSQEEYLNFGLNFGYRANTSFKNFMETGKGATDFLGFDNQYRSLPEGFPSSQQLLSTGQTSVTRENAGKSLTNNFDCFAQRAPVDYGFHFGFAKNVRLGNFSASNLTQINYATNYQYYRASFNRYATFDQDPSTLSTFQNDFTDSNYSHETKISLVHNWLFNVSDRNKIEFKNLFVQIGDNKTMLRTGFDNSQQPGLFNNNAYHYLARTIYSGQLQGTISSLDNTTKFTWLLGTNYVNRNEPDYRRFRRIFDNDRNEFRMILPPSANLFDAGRFYSDLTDKGFSHGLNFERKLGDPENKRSAAIRAGYLVDYKERTFNARYISYLYPGNFDGFYGNELSYQPVASIFSQQNLFSHTSDGNIKDGFTIQEGTRPTDSYTGKTWVAAGYISASVPIGDFDLAGGMRLERFNQTLNLSSGEELVNNSIISPLPFLNVAYNVTDRSLFRLAYSKTVNRPEFREIAPFLFYQFEYNLNIQGNSALKTATVDNVDLRWEMYPNKGEFISFGGFYKKFTNPIEFVQQNASGNLQFSYGNAPTAFSYGVEAEVRKSLSSLGMSQFLRNFSVNLNTSLIKSEVDMGEGMTFQKRFRPLQGQSPYVINTGLYYNDAERGYSINLAYNAFGNRIFSVGSILFPTWIERPRNALDIQLSKSFNNSMEVKLNIQNLLNAPYRIYQDNDENNAVDEKVDDPIQVYKTSQLITLSWNWKFLKE